MQISLSEVEGRGKYGIGLQMDLVLFVQENCGFGYDWRTICAPIPDVFYIRLLVSWQNMDNVMPA